MSGSQTKALGFAGGYLLEVDESIMIEWRHQPTEASYGGNILQHLKLLECVPVQNIEHFGRPLTEHLIGTYDLLVQWGSPQDVCLAGLFHSIYGTKTFQTAVLKTDSRERLRALIGEYAEDLVYVFGMSDRRHLLLENKSAPYCWIDHRTGEAAGITDDTFRHLIEIEVANFVEQIPFLTGNPDQVIRDMRNRFESTALHMSVGAKNAVHRAIGVSDQGLITPERMDSW